MKKRQRLCVKSKKGETRINIFKGFSSFYKPIISKQRNNNNYIFLDEDGPWAIAPRHYGGTAWFIIQRSDLTPG